MEKGTISRTLLVVLVLLVLSSGNTYAQQIIPLTNGTKSSLRGLSVISNSVAWASGSNGFTALTTDGGKNWKWAQVPGYETVDFRDIEAFSATDAVMVNAGSPAIILLTRDGGRSWKEVYRNSSPEIFLDGMDFWDRKHGIIYGDPIAGEMQLLETKDGGNTWTNISKQLKIKLAAGEASFAASGTAIRTGKNGNVWIATGGRQSRIFHSTDFGKSWQAYPCPIIQGENSTGPFSLAFINTKNGVAAGGNYLKDTLRKNNLVITRDGGKTWTNPLVSPFGYRSAIEFISHKVLLATGTSGTDISKDGGKRWQNISSEGFNCVRKAKKGKWILVAGSNGAISSIKQLPQ